MRKLFILIPVLIIVFFIITGQKNPESEKWSNNFSTNLYDPGVINSAVLPQVYDFTNPNTETRHVKTPYEVISVSPNIRVLPRTNSYQSEVDIVRHPTNPMILFGSSNAFNNTGTLFISEGVYVSTDGGITWGGSDTMKLAGGAPVPNQGGDPGITIDKNGTFIQTHLGFSTSGMFGNYSTDNGSTWSSNYTIASGSQDKNLAGTDDSPTSPYYGRSYCVWSLFTSGSPPIDISYTTNGGVSWSTPQQINTPPSGHYSQGCDIRTGPNGEVYVIWAAPVAGVPFTEDFAGFGRSTDGGVNWTVTENAYDMNGIRGIFSSKSSIRVNGFPRIDVDRSGGVRNGWIYTVASEKNISPAGSDPDIIMHRSSNGGTTWSPGIRVNQDPINNGKFQWFPAIRVDEAGGVNIVYYDDRYTQSDSSEVYISRSLDGGNSWSDIQVSDHRFKPQSIGVAGIATGYQGDYIGMTSSNGNLFPIWMDNFSGIYNAWTAPVLISTYPLNSFNLTAPPAGTRISTLQNSTTNFTFDWDTSSSTSSYKWIFGSPTTNPRLLSVNSNTNTLSMTLGQLDNMLSSLGLNQGDSLVGQWDVWAFRNNQTDDSLKAANGSRTITLKRGVPVLSPFSLISPVNNTTILSLNTNSDTVNFSWSNSGQAVNYKWLYASPDFSNLSNIKLRINADNNSFDPSLTLRNSQIDSALAGIGINVGDSSTGQWRVYGYSAGDSLASTQTYNINLRRGFPPTVSSSADSIIVNVLLGQNFSTNLIIGNTGQFSLDWFISESPAALDNLFIRSEFKIDNELNLQQSILTKGSADIYHGQDVTDGMGGPDNFGYRWIDSDEPGGPVFDWFEISTLGTQITNWTSGTADDGSVIIPIPFNFNFYGTDYTQLKICTNGWMGFDIASTSNEYNNIAIPSTIEPDNALFPFWDDHDLRNGGQVFYFNDASNNRFIIEYKDAPHFSTGGPYTYQVMLYSDGRIYFQYLTMNDPVNSATVGIENSTGTDALQVAFNTPYIHDNLAIKIEKGLHWVTENPVTGIIDPGGNQNVNIDFNSSTLSQGIYNGFLQIESNDPATPVKNVKLKFNVGTVGIQNVQTGIPSQYLLAQNYPNPFNPVTNINFSLPKDGLVTLKVYDILGKEVITLVNENKQAGNYRVDFNGSNFASGMYFYKIESGSFVQTRRMILLK